MPIIFAQAIMFIPLSLSGFSADGQGSGFFATFSDVNGFWYNLIYFFLIVAFTYFYTAITVRPTQMAEDMKRNNGFIPGVKPGKATAEYLDSIMSLGEDDGHDAGSIYLEGYVLACAAVLAVADNTLGVLYGHFACALDQKHGADCN